MLAYISARLYGRKRLVPTGRNLAFLALTLALGPGLLVNGLIKEHSHRPRPFQTQDFGGTWQFRPFGDFDGQCTTDCSFVSGKTSTASWSLAPALLTPPPWRAAVIGASLLFTIVMGVERIAYGGHYLSDVMFGALINWALVLAAAMLMRIRLPDRGPPGLHDAPLRTRRCAVQRCGGACAAKLPPYSRAPFPVGRPMPAKTDKDIKKVVLAYSGGLDTSIILKWLQDDLWLRGGDLHRRPRPGRGARAGARRRR